MAELKRMPCVSHIHFIECEANYPLPVDVTVQHTHGKVSCSLWTGVKLSLLLKEVGLKSTAKWIVAEGADRDKHSKSLPMIRAMEDCYVAYGQNGEPLRPHQGFPIRLMVPGYGGFGNVKWLQRIMVVDKPYLTPSERFDVQFGPKSIITNPSGGQQLTDRGFYNITGLAWSGAGMIKSVDVSVDGGGTWKPAKLHDPILPKAQTYFSYEWSWNGKETMIMSRCTDEKGQTQPTVAELAKSVGVSTDDVLTRKYQQPGQWHVVFPWRIHADGRIQHALWS
jgi:sulfane dehydrogenase subunit SoxC